jgi:hypothetical protein
VRCNGEHVEEHIRNMLGTHWEPRKNEKKKRKRKLIREVRE